MIVLPGWRLLRREPETLGRLKRLNVFVRRVGSWGVQRLLLCVGRSRAFISHSADKLPIAATI